MLTLCLVDEEISIPTFDSMLSQKRKSLHCNDIDGIKNFKFYQHEKGITLILGMIYLLTIQFSRRLGCPAGIFASFFLTPVN